MVESEKLYREILPRMRAEQQKGNIKAEDPGDALNNFAYLRRTQGDSHEAELLFRESLALSPKFQERSVTLSELLEARSPRHSPIRGNSRKLCGPHRKQLSRIAKRDKQICQPSDFH